MKIKSFVMAVFFAFALISCKQGVNKGQTDLSSEGEIESGNISTPEAPVSESGGIQEQNLGNESPLPQTPGEAGPPSAPAEPAPAVIAQPRLLMSQQFGSAGFDSVTAMKFAPDSKVYLAGFTTGNFEGLEMRGISDGFVSVYNPQTLVSKKILFGGESRDEINAIAADKNGFFYIAGYTEGSLDGNPARGAGDMFLARYKRTFEMNWIRQVGTDQRDAASAVVIDIIGDVYVAGNTMGSLNGSEGEQDIFVIKYNLAGEKQWVKQIGTAKHDEILEMATDRRGYVYLAGYSMVAAGDRDQADSFIIKLDKRGEEVWKKVIATSADDIVYGVSVDALGNIIACGYTTGNLDSEQNNGGLDIFVVRYNSNGDRQWTKLIGTAGSDAAYSCAEDNAQNIYVGGLTFGSLDGQNNYGEGDAFLLKLGPAGEKQWTKIIGTSAFDAGMALDVDADGNLYFAGNTYGDIDGAGNDGEADVFLLKFGY